VVFHSAGEGRGPETFSPPPARMVARTSARPSGAHQVHTGSMWALPIMWAVRRASVGLMVVSGAVPAL